MNSKNPGVDFDSERFEALCTCDASSRIFCQLSQDVVDAHKYTNFECLRIQSSGAWKLSHMWLYHLSSRTAGLTRAVNLSKPIKLMICEFCLYPSIDDP